MAREGLKITINQSLHGYQDGHQLLAASTNFSLVARRILLFQSDLSGSMEQGFETYITGYPIQESNIYVLTKTWYAQEMERPGCVWSHSLLIDFAELGMIPNFSVLEGLFSRPQLNNYDSYKFKIILDSQHLISSAIRTTSIISHESKVIMKFIYESPNSTCIISCDTSTSLEKEILNIWSNQWPRLRRRFSFCTGALNLRSDDDNEFDLQITPIRSTSNICKQSKNSIVVDFAQSDFDEWLYIFDEFNQQEIHKFFWTFGSDIEGSRENYIPLVRLFKAVYSKEFSLSKVNNYLQLYFPEINKGKFLKKSFFGPKSILPISEKEIIYFLLSNDNSFVDLSDMKISDRIIDLINNAELSFDELVSIITKIDISSLDVSFWDKIELPTDFVLNIVALQPNLVPIFIKYWPRLIENKSTWELDYSIQMDIVKILHANRDSSLMHTPVIEAIIKSGSKIIFDFRKLFGQTITEHTLNLINNGHDVINRDWVLYVIRYDTFFSNWLHEKNRSLNAPIFILIFDYLEPKTIENLKLEVDILLSGFELIRKSISKEFSISISCKLLLIGFSNSDNKNYKLVEKNFSLVYYAASINTIPNHIIKYFIIEKPIVDEDFYNPFSLYFYFQKKKRRQFNVKKDDFCRQLIISTINRFILNKWDPKYFTLIFQMKKEFEDALLYCLTFENGTNLIKKVVLEIQNESIQLNSEQIYILNKMLNK